MEIFLIGLIIIFVAWFAMRWRNQTVEADEETLGRAWRIVLDDPNYAERRPLEEHRRALENDGRSR